MEQILNIIIDLVTTAVVLWLTREHRLETAEVIAFLQEKMKQLEQRNVDLQTEYINALKRLKLPGESDSQVRRSSKTFVPGINEEERMTAIKRMNEE